MRRREPPFGRPAVRLDAWRRRGLYASLALLALSGGLWWWLQPPPGDAALPSPWLAWSMKVHGAATLATVYLMGTMLHSHMLQAWRRRLNRSSGGVMALTLAVLTVTGYGLYYFDGDALRQWTQWSHWAVGVGLPGVLIVHVWAGRRARGVVAVPSGEPPG